MANRDIIVIGGSAGSIEAVKGLTRTFPADMRAAVFIVIHLSPDSISHLPQILNRHGSWKAEHPKDFQPIEQGKIYVAPPDHHMMLEPGVIRIIRGPKENR